MKNAALPTSSPFAALALGAGLTHGDATVVLRPVASAALVAEIVAAIDRVRGIAVTRVIRHTGDVLQLAVSTSRPVALASEMRTALRRRIVSCSAVAGHFVVVLDGDATHREVRGPRFDHRVASDFDRAMGFDSFSPSAGSTVRRTRRVAPVAQLPAPSRPAASAPRLALTAGR